MIRLYLIAAAVLAVVTASTLGIKAVYQAGWDAREKLAVIENAQRQRAAADALLRASDAMAFELGKAVSSDQELQRKLKELEDAQPEDPAVCGISLDRMRSLSAIR